MTMVSLTGGFYTDEHDAYRDSVRRFLDREVVPHYEEWEEAGIAPPEAWRAAGEAGLIGVGLPEEYGGGGEKDYRYRMIVAEESAKLAVTSFAAGLSTHDDIVVHYVADLGSAEQKARWIPGFASGELIGAIAMTEPGAGSDVQGIRTTAVHDGRDWVINGQKTFITNGINAGFVLVVARTDPDAGSRGFTLFAVEDGTPGFERGRRLKKLGLHAQDTAELFFTDARVSDADVIGEVNHGFGYLMERLPRERLSIAVGGLAGAEAAYGWARDYVFERKAFDKRVGDFQATRFELAELETELDVTRAYIERSVLRLNAGELSAVDASKAKWWTTELQTRVTTRALQLFGGYGFMEEYPIARAFRDSRVQPIYGGTNQIMREIIGRDIASRYR